MIGIIVSMVGFAELALVIALIVGSPLQLAIGVAFVAGIGMFIALGASTVRFYLGVQGTTPCPLSNARRRARAGVEFLTRSVRFTTYNEVVQPALQETTVGSTAAAIARPAADSGIGRARFRLLHGQVAGASPPAEGTTRRAAPSGRNSKGRPRRGHCSVAAGNLHAACSRAPGRACSLRPRSGATTPSPGKWSIWWLDARSPRGPLDPPVVGSFPGRYRHVPVR